MRAHCLLGQQRFLRFAVARMVMEEFLQIPSHSHMFPDSLVVGAAGQVVMEGFLQIRLRPWLRRMLTRLIALVPAAIVAGAQPLSGFC